MRISKVKKPDWKAWSIDTAAAIGSLQHIKYLHKRGGRCSPHAIDNAAARGDITMVKWLCENRREGCTEAAIICAIRGGHTSVVRFLHGEGLYPRNITPLITALQFNQVRIFKWLFRRSIVFSYDILLLAAEDGSANILRCVLNIMEKYPQYFAGCLPKSWASKPFEIAIDGGFLEFAELISKYLGREYDGYQGLLNIAASKGNLASVVWLRKNYGLYSREAKDLAINNGHKYVSEWLNDNPSVEDAHSDALSAVIHRMIYTLID
jgi:hypothetical protein